MLLIQMFVFYSLSISSKLGMPVGITYEQKVDYTKQSFSRLYNVMYVTTAVKEKDVFNSTMNFIKDNFKIRDQTQKEIWLMGFEISDKSNFEKRCSKNKFISQAIFEKLSRNLCSVRNALIDVELDINDDVFVYIIDSDSNQEKMLIYEVYKNHEGGVPILNYYAVWFEGVGMLKHSDLDKYMRRRSLQVRVPC